jgi:hypothetical protein
MLSPFFKSMSPTGLSQLNISLFGWSYLNTLILVMKSLSLARSQPRASVAPGRIGYILSAKLKRTIIGVAINSIIIANDIIAHIDTNTSVVLLPLIIIIMYALMQSKEATLKDYEVKKLFPIVDNFSQYISYDEKHFSTEVQ